MSVMDRFTAFESSAPKLYLNDGDYYVWVLVIGGSWSWTLWLKDTPLQGRKDWNMDTPTACQEGLDALERAKAADRRPYFADTI